MKNMKNLSKRGLALFLTLVMCLSMVQITAFAVEETEATPPTLEETIDNNDSSNISKTVETNQVPGGIETGDGQSNDLIADNDDNDDTTVHGNTPEAITLPEKTSKEEDIQADTNSTEHKHNWEFDKTIDDATCSTNRIDQYQCHYVNSGCGEIKEVEVKNTELPAEFGNWEDVDGNQHRRICKLCNGTADNHIEYGSHKDADKDGQCDDCGYEMISKHECDFQFDKVLEEATCSTNRIDQYQCHYVNDGGGCGEIKEVEIENTKLPAQFGAWEYANEFQHRRICQLCSGTAENHIEYRPHEDLNEDGKCDVCEKAEHVHTLVMHNGYPATCTTSGSKSYYCCSDPACGETFSDAAGKIAATKEDLVIPTLDPVFEGSKWTEQDGLKHSRLCINCNGEAYGHIEYGTHDFGSWYTPEGNAATCTNNGVEIRECKDCGYKDTRVISVLGHKWSDKWESDDAKGHYLICDRCQSHDESKPHNFGEWYDIADQGPTCATEGRQVHECTDCGYKEERGVITLDPEFGPWELYNDTQHKKICKNCDGAVEKHTEYADHSFGGWSIVKAASALEEGLEKRACTDCGYEQTRIIPATGGGSSGGGGGGGSRPTPTPDPDPEEVDIPDPDVPLVEVPDVDVPLVEIPEEEVPLVELPEEEVPLAEVPKTGARSLLWQMSAALSAAGLLILAVLERRQRRGE